MSVHIEKKIHFCKNYIRDPLEILVLRTLLIILAFYQCCNCAIAFRFCFSNICHIYYVLLVFCKFVSNPTKELGEFQLTVRGCSPPPRSPPPPVIVCTVLDSSLDYAGVSWSWMIPSLDQYIALQFCNADIEESIANFWTKFDFTDQLIF